MNEIINLPGTRTMPEPPRDWSAVVIELRRETAYYEAAMRNGSPDVAKAYAELIMRLALEARRIASRN